MSQTAPFPMARGLLVISDMWSARKSGFGATLAGALTAVVAFACSGETTGASDTTLDSSTDAGSNDASATTDASDGGQFCTVYACCDHDPGLPDATTLSCEPGAPDAVGCGSVPEKGGSWDAGGATYPIGCTVTYPQANPWYPCSALFCDCMQTPGYPPEWVCPI